MLVPVRWLVAANAVWLLAGLAAYATRLPMLVGAALAAAVSVPGLRALRRDADGEQRLWADRGLSFAAGTWAVLLVVVLLPLITLEEGGPEANLWSGKGYWAVTLVVASVGMLLADACAFLALRGERDTVRTYGLFHAVLLLAALWVLWTQEHVVATVTVAGEALRAYDLRLAPALAAVPGLTWALAFWRMRAQGPA